MSKFYIIKATIYLTIYPKFLNDPFICIYKQLSKFLLTYSKTFDGIMLSFTIQGITPNGRILDDGSVYVNTLIEACVLKIKVGDKIQATDGMYMNTFSCEVDKEDSFNGEFIVKNIHINGKIIGTGIMEEEF